MPPGSTPVPKGPPEPGFLFVLLSGPQAWITLFETLPRGLLKFLPMMMSGLLPGLLFGCLPNLLCELLTGFSPAVLTGFLPGPQAWIIVLGDLPKPTGPELPIGLLVVALQSSAVREGFCYVLVLDCACTVGCKALARTWESLPLVTSGFAHHCRKLATTAVNNER